MLVNGTLPCTFSSFGCFNLLWNGSSPCNLVDGWAMDNVVMRWSPESTNSRSTMGIVWTCLLTIFACSWTVVHPNFPDTGTFGSKKVVCALTVISPELVAYQAFIEYHVVRRCTRTIRKITTGQWSMPQSFFIQMRGIKLEFQDGSEFLGRPARCAETEKCFLGFVALSDWDLAVRLGLLDTKVLSVEDVRKRAKTSLVAKAAVCLQASWLVAQVTGRAINGLSITTLEVVTMAYVLCAFIIYAFWWHKPQDAEVHVKVDCSHMQKADFYQRVDEIPPQDRLAFSMSVIE